MKKSLLAAAMTAALAAPAANAGVVLYGKIHASIDYIDTSASVVVGQDSESFSESAWYVANRASRIGFKGTEDLGNGMSLIWKAETTYNLTESGDGWGGGRNAYIGLTGDWGTFLYGRHDTPMKISTGKLDLFGDQIGDYNYSPDPQNALLGPGFNDVRAANAIAYISPNWNGLTVAAAIVPGESPSSTPEQNANGLADIYSIAAMYSNNGLYLSAAYESANSEVINTALEGTDFESYKQWRVGAGYTMNAFTVGFVYENQSGIYPDPVSSDVDIWQVSAAYDFGNNRIKGAYGEYKWDVDIGGSPASMSWKRKSWAVGLDHSLSKRTKAYVAYANSDNDIHFEGIIDFDIDLGVDMDGFSMGMMHSF